MKGEQARTDIKLKVFLADALAEMPQYATEHSSGMDLKSVQSVVLGARQRVLVPTGLRMRIPHGYEGQVRPRSGLALKHGITVLNTPGTVDSDYTGEIKVVLYNTTSEAFKVEPGMRIAQLVIAPVARVEVVQVEDEDDLGNTARGSGGFGHTGTN